MSMSCFLQRVTALVAGLMIGSSVFTSMFAFTYADSREALLSLLLVAMVFLTLGIVLYRIALRGTAGGGTD